MRLNKFFLMFYKTGLLQVLITLIFLSAQPVHAESENTPSSSDKGFNIATIAEGLVHPWGMAFLPN